MVLQVVIEDHQGEQGDKRDNKQVDINMAAVPSFIRANKYETSQLQHITFTHKFETGDTQIEKITHKYTDKRCS